MPDGRRKRDEDDERPRRGASRAGGAGKRTGSARGAGAPGRGRAQRDGRPAKRSGTGREQPRDDERPRRPVKRTGGARTTSRDGDRPRRPSPARGGDAQGRSRSTRGEPRGRGERRGASGGRDKRTSRSSDDRNPTRSGIQYPSRKTRRPDGEAEVEAPRRAVLRTVRGEQPKARATRERKAAPAKARPSRRRRKPTEALDELARLAGRGAAKAQDQLGKAAEAFAAGRERDALRLLRPLRDAYPEIAAVRELMGLSQYRVGNFDAAAKELEAFADLAGSVEQHPVLMDCARAKRKYRRVDELWRELADASPSGALVTEGRIVLAGSLADRGRLREAIATLERRETEVKRVQEHHLRAWYALGDLCERAGDIPRARQLFMRVRKHEPGFADVAERLASLG